MYGGFLVGKGPGADVTLPDARIRYGRAADLERSGRASQSGAIARLEGAAFRCLS